MLSLIFIVSALIQLGTNVTMVHAPTSLRDPNASTSAFGAAGPCRTANYGMPSTILNTMRLCTQADNQPADPTVPSGPSSAQWGPEYCADSPFDIPWGTQGPPSVGTLPDMGLMGLLDFGGWGPDAPAPLRTCAADADCCSACVCLQGANGGVCAVRRAGACAVHAHCGSGLMCAGDGTCVQPMLEVWNNGTSNITFRTHSSSCAGANLSTWGVSKEQIVPDLLSNSGMCSYRSWFEHRNLQGCGASTCSVSSTSPWNFSTPTATNAQGAFAAGVLQTLPHACDRDYEHYEGLVSCSPGPSYLLRNQILQAVSTQGQANRTRTWTPDRQLQVVRHGSTLNNLGVGFTGLNLTYSQLGYGSVGAAGTGFTPRPCSSYAICALQSDSQMWYVNGAMQTTRLLTQPDNTVRAYAVADMMRCGSMGFIWGTGCQIDPAVAPLFYLRCVTTNFQLYNGNDNVCKSYPGGSYASGQSVAALASVASNLNGLYGSLTPTVSTWSDYLVAVDLASYMWGNISLWSTWATGKVGVSQRYGGAQPMGLYWLMSYGAYEVPFAWWFRCGWLMRIPMSANPTDCGIWSQSATDVDSFAAINAKPGEKPSVPLMTWLAASGGAINSTMVGLVRDAVHGAFASIVQSIRPDNPAFTCYKDAKYRENLKSDASYVNFMLSTLHTVPVVGPKGIVCNTSFDCLDHGQPLLQMAKNLVDDMVASLVPRTCSGPFCSGGYTAWGQDYPPATVPSDQAWMPLFQYKVDTVLQAAKASLQSKYDPLAAGCNIYPCCGPLCNGTCTCASPTLSDTDLKSCRVATSLAELKPDVPANVLFDAVSLDICDLLSSTTDLCPVSKSTMASSIQDMYCNPGTSPYTTSNTEACVWKGSGLTLDALGNKSIGGATMKMDAVGDTSVAFVNAFTAKPAICYTRKCPGKNDETIRVWQDPNQGVTTYQLTCNQWNYPSPDVYKGHRYRYECKLFEDSTLKFQYSANCMWARGCTIAPVDMLRLHQIPHDNYNEYTYSTCTGNSCKDLMTDIHSSIEFYYSGGENTAKTEADVVLWKKCASTSTLKNSISHSGCNFQKITPAETKTYTLMYAEQVETAQANEFCNNLGWDECSLKSKDPGCTWQQKADIAHLFGQCDQPSDWQNCMDSFKGTDCAQKHNVILTKVGYSLKVDRKPCSNVYKECPWEDYYSKAYLDNGAPDSAFCPDTTKASAIYKKLRSNDPSLLELSFSSVTNIVPQSARHFSVRLNQIGNPPRKLSCSQPNCGPLQHAVQLRKGLWTCVDCMPAPVYNCLGLHSCSFGGSSFTDTFIAIAANLTTGLAAATLGVNPYQPPWLKPTAFTNYNPQNLALGFNQMITNLGGQCNTQSTPPVFGQCQNDQPRRTLRTHFQNTYTVQEGAAIPRGWTMTWPVNAAQLTGTNLPAWESTRPTSFVTQLLDDSVCSRFTLDSLVCLQTTTTQVLNPVLVGSFEVQEGCDAVNIDGNRVVDGLCNQMVCPPNSKGTSDLYNTFSGTDPTNPLTTSQCAIHNRRQPQFYTVTQSNPLNLCSKTAPRPPTCSVNQSTLGWPVGGWDGSPVSTLYSTVAQPPSPQNSLLSGLNPILNFGKPPANTIGNLTLSPLDIGGQYVRMTLGPNNQLMVTSLPLRAYSSMVQAVQLNSSNWIKSWINVRLGVSKTPHAPCTTWACPLRRRAHWASMRWDQATPNRARTTALWGWATHPTTLSRPLAAQGTYGTWDGFTVCLGVWCATRNISTVAALWDGTPRLATVLQNSCTQQLDWPYTGGVMRDGSWLAPNITVCPVLDRLPPFRWRYVNSRTTTAASTTTFSTDCHMGRAARGQLPTYNCTVVAKNDTAVVVSCGGVNTTLQRPLEPNTRMVTTNKTRCGRCDPLPTWKSSNGQPIAESEVSYGQLWRWAPSRRLARDLRFRMCGNDTYCPQAAHWTLQNFWPSMLEGNPLRTGAVMSPSQLFKDVGPDTDQTNWDDPWMLCLANGTCQGSIPKQTWLKGDKATQCKAISSLSNANSATVNLNVCNLDSRLDALCTLIQQARYRVFEANCQVAGSCRTTGWFYQPATYDMTNDEFVRSTVGDFYNFTQPGSCPAMDKDTLAILAQNRQTVQGCQAQTLESLQVRSDSIYPFLL